jgi:hypothetical protein
MKLFISNYCLLDEGVIQDLKSSPAGNRKFQEMVVSPSALKSLSKDNAGIFSSSP